MFEAISGIVPVTVIAAVLLFFVKELLEILRRKAGENRKKKAYRVLLGEELERNHWTYKTLLRLLDSIEGEIEHCDRPVFYVHYTKEGKEYFRSKSDPKQKGFSGGPIPPVYLERYNQLLADVAVLDKKLFPLTRSAYESIIELRHMRESFINILNDEDKELFEKNELLRGFIDYVKSDKDEIYASMDQLYQECTGMQLTKAKLR